MKVVIVSGVMAVNAINYYFSRNNHKDRGELDYINIYKL